MENNNNLQDKEVTGNLNQDQEATQSRREFFRTASLVGAMGAIGVGAGFTPSVQAQPQSPSSFAKPDGLLPGGQSDSRFPVSFEDSVGNGLRLTMAFFTALNQRDLEGIASLLHFPFAIYEDIEPLVYQSASEFINNPPPCFSETGNRALGQRAMLPGSYDMLEGINVHLYCPVGGVFSLKFKRFTPDGHKLMECDNLLSVTNNDGRWAIQLISTIFHEAGYENNTYPDAEVAYRLGSQGYLSAFGYRDEELLNDRSNGRGSYEPSLPLGTRTASVSFNYSPRDRTNNARNNEPMKGWVTEGVTSRLRVSEVSEPSGEYDTNLDQFVELAGGTVGDYGYTRIIPVEPLVIHATHDKAHVMGGYWRYTPAGVLISETRSVGIRIRKAGNWGSGGNLGQVTHHDRSNSKG
ncbi:hypothetical protein GCM10011403_12370 [Pseudohongiella nitratireducens]|uniref:Uncharacterized protein n=1 Tax=Pseudohongiella nitratireducens TaxID=1768907 RepID=A0A917GU66_9GAMM|nr:hypothetical protein [Pseudohongiella nitratireducens]GGG56741.1 hypothetical protein GCM10011403_12370 [Pseudohongiella nitratireducens]